MGSCNLISSYTTDNKLQQWHQDYKTLSQSPQFTDVHDILHDYCAEFPSDNMLKKWVIDIAKGAEKVYNTHQVPVRTSGNHEVT